MSYLAYMWRTEDARYLIDIDEPSFDGGMCAVHDLGLDGGVCTCGAAEDL